MNELFFYKSNDLRSKNTFKKNEVNPVKYGPKTTSQLGRKNWDVIPTEKISFSNFTHKIYMGETNTVFLSIVGTPSFHKGGEWTFPIGQVGGCSRFLARNVASCI